MSMVVRRESDGLRRYCHLGTGNYHPRTARGYTDYSLFTCDPEIGQDVHELFLQLTSLTQTPRLTRLLQSPFGLHEAVIAKIEREADVAASGKPGRIIAKMNSLVDPHVIEALYRASRAGVQIDLMIRGLCALRPGIPGVSDNIRVRSIVGRFLEHSRVFYFGNDGASELYLASADWMERNFFRRVELAVPILDKKLKMRVIEEGLKMVLSDNCQSWQMDCNGQYTRRKPSGTRRINAQEQLLNGG
jgi:polyphosphate kinase